MTHITMREATRLLFVACGVLSAAVSIISAMSLLCARSEPGVVKFYSELHRGEPTNVAYIVWGTGMHLRLESGDRPTPPKAGDNASVLVFGKAGTLKFGRAFWRAWTWILSFGVIGVVLLISGLFIMRHWPPHSPSSKAPQATHAARAI